MLEAIRLARVSIRLETYIYSEGNSGRQFLAALLAAAQRGVRVRVLVDAFGSWVLPDDFFAPLLAAGAEVQFFNPLRLWRYGVRDHRKLLVCDDSQVFVGGFNIADEYDGDGVARGWFDLGARIENPVLAGELARSFDELFAAGGFSPATADAAARLQTQTQIPTRTGGTIITQPSGPGRQPVSSRLAPRFFPGARDPDHLRLFSADASDAANTCCAPREMGDGFN